MSKICQKFLSQGKITNLHYTKPALLYSNEENLCSKNFWNESSIQVVTRKAPPVQVLKKKLTNELFIIQRY